MRHLWCAVYGCSFKVILAIFVDIVDIFELAVNNIVYKCLS